MASFFVQLHVASFVFMEALMGLLNKYIAMARVKNGLPLSWQEMAAEKAIQTGFFGEGGFFLDA